MIYIDPHEHSETGSHMPFWIRLPGTSHADEITIRQRLADLLGEGSRLGGKWASKDVDGYFTLMFRSPEDRDLARLSI